MAEGDAVLLIVEDLQWADAATLDLLRALAVGLTGRTALLVTVRTDEALPPAIRATVADLVRDGAERIELVPFRRDELARLAAAVREPAAPEIDDERLDALLERTGGNAFLALELIDAGLLEPGAPDGVVPASLRDILGARLGALDDAVIEVLRAAAVQPGPIDDELLGVVLRRPVGAIGAALRVARDAGVLTAFDGAHAFRNAIQAELLVDQLGSGERRTLHAAYADALAEGRGPARATAAAWHRDAAGDAAGALAAHVAATDAAMRAAAFEAASRHAARAAELRAELPPDADPRPARSRRLLDGPRSPRCSPGDPGNRRASRARPGGGGRRPTPRRRCCTTGLAGRCGRPAIAPAPRRRSSERSPPSATGRIRTCGRSSSPSRRPCAWTRQTPDRPWRWPTRRCGSPWRSVRTMHRRLPRGSRPDPRDARRSRCRARRTPGRHRAGRRDAQPPSAPWSVSRRSRRSSRDGAARGRRSSTWTMRLPRPMRPGWGGRSGHRCSPRPHGRASRSATGTRPGNTSPQASHVAPRPPSRPSSAPWRFDWPSPAASCPRRRCWTPGWRCSHPRSATRRARPPFEWPAPRPAIAGGSPQSAWALFEAQLAARALGTEPGPSAAWLATLASVPRSRRRSTPARQAIPRPGPWCTLRRGCRPGGRARRDGGRCASLGTARPCPRRPRGGGGGTARRGHRAAGRGLERGRSRVGGHRPAVLRRARPLPPRRGAPRTGRIADRDRRGARTVRRHGRAAQRRAAARSGAAARPPGARRPPRDTPDGRRRQWTASTRPRRPTRS